MFGERCARMCLTIDERILSAKLFKYYAGHRRQDHSNRQSSDALDKVLKRVKNFLRSTKHSKEIFQIVQRFTKMNVFVLL